MKQLSFNNVLATSLSGSKLILLLFNLTFMNSNGHMLGFKPVSPCTA